MLKAAVIVFPASNCDRDAITTLEKVFGETPKRVWHTEPELPDVDLVVLPGGFSYGDYLRCGAMSARSPIMPVVIEHAKRGGLTLGICNGFQILTECGLLPGALMSNAGLKFVCKETYLKVENAATPFTRLYEQDQVLNIPVAHHDGNYFAAPDQLKALEDNGQVAFRYCTADGEITPEANPNGSMNNIAGIVNEKGNVLGMMPHPERHADVLTGGTDGIALFAALAALEEAA